MSEVLLHTFERPKIEDALPKSFSSQRVNAESSGRHGGVALAVGVVLVDIKTPFFQSG